MNTPAVRKAATALALAAMVLRALLPAGWMPATTGAHGATLVICTMTGPKRMTLPDAPSKNQQQQPPDHASGPCPFGVAAVAFAPPLPPAIPVPCAPAQYAAQTVLSMDVPSQERRIANSPRAPPSIV
jgi:hypothetical protein